jgi:hypothetical protein
LPSRTADPAGAAVAVGRALGAAAVAADRLEVVLEPDELELLSSLLPHFPMAKRTTMTPTTTSATFPPLDFFGAVATGEGP